MITGDNQLTAAHVGIELEFGPNQAAFAQEPKGNQIKWVDSDAKEV